MSSATSEKKVDSPKGSGPSPLEKARQARADQASNRKAMTDGDKYAIQLCRQAAKACKMVVRGIEGGKRPDAKVLEAAAFLSGSVASGLFDSA